jgi:glycosyltransferase involved in cell wall biosynthesis
MAHRILFLSSCVRGGGAGWSLYYLLKHLDRTQIDPLVAVPERGIFDRRFAELDLRVITPPGLPHRVRQQRFDRDETWSRASSLLLNLGGIVGGTVPDLVRTIRREGIELVYCNNMMVKPIGAAAAQIAGIPCVLHVRNLHESPPAVAFYGSLARLPAVRRIIANSSASAEPYRRVAPSKVVVVHNGVDLEEYDRAKLPVGAFRREHGLEGRLVVGFTGNVIPRKGVEELVRAAAQVLPSRPDAVFVVVGRVPMGQPEDWQQSYSALAERLGIADRFRFVGFCDDVRAAVADFDILVLPSRQEPFGRSIIEAMALGVPVVASRVGGIPEIIEHERDGLLVRPGDADDLARALARLLDDPALRQSLGQAGRSRVEAAFDVAKGSVRMQELLLAALRG